MSEQLTTTELEAWLGVSNPTIFHLRNRENDPLPAANMVKGTGHQQWYDRTAVKAWLERNPDYPRPYRHREGKLAKQARSREAFDSTMANAFLTGRL